MYGKRLGKARQAVEAGQGGRDRGSSSLILFFHGVLGSEAGGR